MSTTAFRLRSDLKFTPVRSGGGLRYVVDDPVAGRATRLGPLEYSFCSMFHRPTEVVDALEQLQRMPWDHPLSQVKLQKLLAWTMQSGLLEPGLQADPSSPKRVDTPIADKSNTRNTRKPRGVGRPFDPSFFRWKVLSSHAIHRLCEPFKFLISWPMLLCASIVWIAAGIYAFQNWQQLQSVAVKLFVPGSQWWWLAAWVILKGVHEFGHAVACERVNVRTSGAGVGFIFLAPTPFVDVTRVWSVENRWYRILVGAAGMLFEITVAAVAVIFACWTDSASIKYLCVSIASLGTLSTVAFNANPMMRYDGYYMLIDWLGRPNFWQDANRAMKAFVVTLFYDGASPVSGTPLMIAYGFAAWVSRILVLVTMGWGVYMAWDGVGFLVVCFFACLWFVLPQWKKLRRQATNATTQPTPKLSRRKVALACFVACSIAGIGFLPSPIQIYWPAIVDYVEPQELRTGAPGFVSEVYALDGQRVKQGEPVLRMKNPELELEYARIRSELESCRETCNSLRSQRKVTDLQCEVSRLESLEVHVAELQSKVDALDVRALRDGVLIARSSKNWIGSYFEEGHALGMIADPKQIEVSASIPQAEWERVSNHFGDSMDIHPFGGPAIAGRLIKSKPHTEEVLESPALAAMYGGPLVVTLAAGPDGKEQLTTEQPRLATRIKFEGSDRASTLPVGALCSVRFTNDRESIWAMLYRHGEALLRRRLPDESSSSQSQSFNPQP